MGAEMGQHELGVPRGGPEASLGHGEGGRKGRGTGGAGGERTAGTEGRAWGQRQRGQRQCWSSPGNALGAEGAEWAEGPAGASAGGLQWGLAGTGRVEEGRGRGTGSPGCRVAKGLQAKEAARLPAGHGVSR